MDRASHVWEDVFLDSNCACNPNSPRGWRPGSYLLFWTSLAFMVPITLLYHTGGHALLMITTAGLMCTSLAYHSTHHRIVRACDVFMCIVSGSTGTGLLFQQILNQAGYGSVFLWAALACFIASGSIVICECFHGKYDPKDPDDPQKMIRLIPHACMHIFTATAFTMLGLAESQIWCRAKTGHASEL